MIRKIFTVIFTLISLLVCLFCGFSVYMFSVDTVMPTELRKMIPLAIGTSIPFVIYLIKRVIKIIKYYKNKPKTNISIQSKRKIALVCLVIVVVSGFCINYNSYKSIAKRTVKSQLKNPKSAQFSDIQKKKYDNSVTVTGTVRGMNGFGGYTVSSFDVMFDKNKDIYYIDIE